MKVCGIVSEYNPFHNGHKLHIEKSRLAAGASHVICVMSGNFVQRGEPACFDKWLRARAALLSGADMIIELPVLYSTASAEFFAASAVRLISDTNIASAVCFGSESCDIERLKKTAALLAEESGEMIRSIKASLKEGVAFPRARAEALEKLSGENCFLENPNDILALEYIKAIHKFNLPLEPVAIKREGAGYNSTSLKGRIASATAIRQRLYNISELEDFVPEESLFLMKQAVSKGMGPVCADDFSEHLAYCLRNLSRREISSVLDITEGLENRILEKSQDFFSFNSLADAVKTKRYVRTKIMRALLHILLGIEKKDLLRSNSLGYVPYIRVLGFRKESEFLIKEMSKKSPLPVITSFKKAREDLSGNAARLLLLEEKATDIYSLSAKPPSRKALGREYTEPLIVV